MNKLNELIELTELWFKDVGLLEKGNPIKQAEKGVEEADEYFDAVKSGDRAKQVDELGDCFVTMIGDSLINKMPLTASFIESIENVERFKFENVYNSIDNIYNLNKNQYACSGVNASRYYLASVKYLKKEIQLIKFLNKLENLVKCSVSNDIPLHEALYFAYQKIQNRVDSGRVIDGQFYKEEDIPDHSK